jgi:hypothetical protein
MRYYKAMHLNMYDPEGQLTGTKLTEDALDYLLEMSEYDVLFYTEISKKEMFDYEEN